VRQSQEQEVRTLRALFWSDRDPDGRVFAPLADAYRKAGEVKEALDLLSDGRARHPDYATGHVVAARVFLDQGMQSEAELAARQALALDAENVVALSTLATVLETMGETEEVGRLRSALLELDPEAEEELAARQEAHASRGRPAAPPAFAQPSESESLEEPGSDALELFGLVDSDTDSTKDRRAAETMRLDFSGAEDVGREPDGIDLPETMLDLSPISAEHDPFEAMAPVSDAPSLAPEPSEALADLSALAPEPESSDDFEPVLELESLEPDPEPVRFGEPILELESLEPDPEPVRFGEPIAFGDAVDLGTLAPDPGPAIDPFEPVVDLDDLAATPEVEVRGDDIFELSSLAPDAPEPAEYETTFDLAELAPDPTPAGEEEAIDLAWLAPDEPAEDVLDLSALAPDEPEDVLELDALAPDPVSPPAASPSEPVWTRTLAELYVKQGFVDKAIVVLEHLRDENPGATDIPARIAELRSGGGSPPAATLSRPSTPPSASPTTEGFAEDDEEMEALARELADGGGGHEVDTPFAWTDRDADADADADPGDDDGAAIGDYFDRLLEWQPGDRS
jgi:tetratricopeptide (TPR) repeat protein